MNHFSIIQASLESDDTIAELPVVPVGVSEQDIQIQVLNDLTASNTVIANAELSIDKVKTAHEQLTHYADVLTKTPDGISQESFDLIAYGLSSSLKNVGMRLTDKSVDLESFSVAESVATAYDLRNETDRLLDFTHDIQNGDVSKISTEAEDHTDDDINAGIDDDDEAKKKEGEAAAAADAVAASNEEGGEAAGLGDDTGAAADADAGATPPATDAAVDTGTPAGDAGAVDGVGATDAGVAADGTDGTDATGADDGVTPDPTAVDTTATGEPHQPVEEPAALQADNDPSPTINMLMRDGEVQISIESIHNFTKRLDVALEGFVHEIFRGIYEGSKKLIGGYESVGRDAQALLPKAQAFVAKVKESGVNENDFTLVHPDRLIYKGKLDINHILEGQEVLKSTHAKVVNDLPKIINSLTAKTNNFLQDLVKVNEKDGDVEQADIKMAAVIFKDYKQSLVNLFPEELPGGYRVEFTSASLGWSDIKQVTKAESFDAISISDLDLLPKLLENVIAMSKLFSSRKGQLEAINKQAKANETNSWAAKVDTDFSDLAHQLETIERQHARVVTLYFEIVFKHCLSTLALVRSAITGSTEKED